MDIYLVTAGIYSDYRIRAAFSTKELAERFVLEFNKGIDEHDMADLEVWALDAKTEDRKLPVYSWYIYLADGNTPPGYGKESEMTMVQSNSDRYTRGRIEGTYAVGESTVSLDHARKLAVEAHQRWLREKGAG